MQILSLENTPGRRQMLRHALELTGKPYVLNEISALAELSSDARLGELRLAVIGADELDNALKAIVYLRGQMPAGRIIVHGEFSALDKDTPTRLRQAGADMVFDSRYTASKMALLINRFIQDPPSEPIVVTPAEIPAWLLRQAVRATAPGVANG